MRFTRSSHQTLFVRLRGPFEFALTSLPLLCHPVAALNPRDLMSLAVAMWESDDNNLQQVVCLVEAGKLEAGL
jgi:hypothetical protein